jgi:hypothetical protein
MRGSVIGVTAGLLAVVVGEVVGDDGHVSDLRVVGQGDGDGRWCALFVAAPFEDESDGVGMRTVVGHGFGDGGFEFVGAVGVEEAEQGRRAGAEVGAALGEALEERVGLWDGVPQAVDAPMLASVPFPGDEGFDVGGVLDLLGLVVGAGVGGDDVLAVLDADGVAGRDDLQGLPDTVMGDGVVVEIETDVRGLSRVGDDPLVGGVAGLWKRAECALLALPGLSDGQGAVLRAGPVGSGALAPGERLRVEVVEVLPLPGWEEGGADVADGALDAGLLVSPVGGDGARLVAVVPGEVEEDGVEADGVALALEDGALEVVVEADPGDASEVLEGGLVASQEVLHAMGDVELDEEVPGPGQDHDEGDERSDGLSDLDGSEVGPVDLGLFAGQGSEAGEGFDGWPGAPEVDHVTEVVGLSGVASLAAHPVEGGCVESRVLAEGLVDEIEVGVEPGLALLLGCVGDAGADEDAAHGAVVDVEVGGDGADAPLLGEVEAEDGGLGVLGDGHGLLGCGAGLKRGVLPPRRGPRRRNGETEAPQKAQWSDAKPLGNGVEGSGSEGLGRGAGAGAGVGVVGSGSVDGDGGGGGP